MAIIHKKFKVNKEFADAIERGRTYIFVDKRLCPKRGDRVRFEVIHKGELLNHEICKRKYVIVDAEQPPQVHESVFICTIKEVYMR